MSLFDLVNKATEKTVQNRIDDENCQRIEEARKEQERRQHDREKILRSEQIHDALREFLSSAEGKAALKFLDKTPIK